MKTIKLLTLLILGLLVFMAACKDEDDSIPAKDIEIDQVVLSDDNTSLIITFNQAIYGDANQTDPLTSEDFDISISNFPVDSVSFMVSHTPGEKDLEIELTYTAYPDGDEIMEITSKAGQIFGEQGNALSANLENFVSLTAIILPKQINIDEVELSDDNALLSIFFNQKIYGNSDLNDSISLDAVEINISNYPPDSLNYNFNHSPGDDFIEFQLDFLQPANGNQQLEISFLAGKIFGETGQSLEKDLEVLLDINRMTAKFEILDFLINQDNSLVTITVNEGMYSENNMTGNLSGSDFLIGFSDATTTFDYTIEHTAGQPDCYILFEYSNWENNDQILEVTFLPYHIYDALGRPMIDSLRIFSTVNDPGDAGIIGNWSAYDISEILESSGFDDSLYANFHMDQNYMITAYQAGIPINFEGTYEMVKTEFDDIWEIELNQSSPVAVISEGIFKVFAAVPDSMWYEVVQVDPAIPGVTPPTAEEGFGSTSGGAFGAGNIQKYHRIEPE